MKTKTFTTFAFFLLLLTTSMNAQNYQKGYIITNEKDTIEGLINLRTDNMNARQCEFKTNEEADKTIYYPGDITGYRFMPNGKYYISHDATIDGQTKTVFLEYLVHGTIDLYYYDSEGNGDNVYYFFEKGGQMNAFTKEPDKVEGVKVIKDNKYVGHVKYYFKDYPMVMGEVDKMTFTQASFIDIAQTYHAETCTPGQPCIIYENQHPDERSIKAEISAFVGVQLATYTANAHVTEEMKIQGVQPVIGAKISVFNPRWSKYLRAQVEVALSRIDATKSRKAAGGNATHTIRIQHMTGNAKVGLECTLPLSKIRPFIAAGLSHTFAFADNSKFTSIYREGKPLEEPYPTRNFYFGGYATIGADYLLKNNHAVTLQASMYFNLENSKTSNDTKIDRLNIIHIAAGYKF
ncbi:hypothetical protein [Bacteroides sp. UBA939]|uniref:hypothetical protein n=1 Tax=Bacteroides sp. UBA939 TaxID=1946092 RepID=UPI0025C05FD3|nr:hypothetical protein [Bacteroides sp. UBA939]